MVLNRKALESRKPHFETVDVPNNGTYGVRVLFDADIDEAQERAKVEGKGTFLPLMLALSLVDEEGNRLFTIDEFRVVGKLIPFPAIDPLWKKIEAINGLKVLTPPEVGDALKNSGTTPA